MKRSLLLIISLFFGGALYSTSLEDRYVMKTFDNGQLYFIAPYDIPSQLSKTKALSADITYLTISDSITMNISVWTTNELATDSIVLVAQDRFPIYNFQTFFIEMDGKLWMHRYSLRYPLSKLVQLYGSPEPFSLCVYANEKCYPYSWSAKSWKKEQIWMNQILHIIISNKRLYEKERK